MYKTFSSFCAAEGLRMGTIQQHFDGFVFMRAQRKANGMTVVIYYDEEEGCVLYY